MVKLEDDCKTCKHGKKYHAIPENHGLGTAHCTKRDCRCQNYLN